MNADDNSLQYCTLTGLLIADPNPLIIKTFTFSRSEGCYWNLWMCVHRKNIQFLMILFRCWKAFEIQDLEHSGLGFGSPLELKIPF